MTNSNSEISNICQAVKGLECYLKKTKATKLPLNQYGNINRRIVLRTLGIKDLVRNNKKIKSIFDDIDKCLSQVKVASMQNIRKSQTTRLETNKIALLKEAEMTQQNNLDYWFSDYGRQVLL